MARLDDWLSLANSTIRSLDGKQVSGLYSMEWPEARRSLVAEYEEEIEKEPRRGVRYARFASALLYGLVKRLAPTRRVLFAASLLLIIVGLVHVAQYGTTVTNLFFIGSSFLIMMLLLGLELLDKLKYRDELELARELQAGLIPEILPDHPAFEMAAANRIANMVGGDIYDFVCLPDGRLAVLFGDASGHGMAAGLVMAVTQASFRTQLEIDPEPQTIIASLNRILCRVGGPRSFFAGIYLLITPDGEMRSTVAGHPPILRLDSDGSVLERIGEGSYPLGIRDDRQWPTIAGRLRPGESLLLHSDGLAEARNDRGEDYGFDRVERVVGRVGGTRPQNIVSLLLHDWETFRGDLPIQDDLSIAVIRRR
jgi:serine phosphatase RsbU (regulator of sigma subunit)